jgi:uncharacterized protein (TIGR00251 family)
LSIFLFPVGTDRWPRPPSTDILHNESKRNKRNAARGVAKAASLRRKEPIRLAVYIQPRASKTELAGRHDGSIKIRIASPPVDNAANRELIEFVAERLGMPKGKVRIVSGATSRRKVLEIEGATATAIAAAFPDP